MPATNAINECSFSAINRIKTYLRNTRSENKLNHSMILLAHCKKADEINMIQIVKELDRNNQTKLRIFVRFNKT